MKSVAVALALAALAPLAAAQTAATPDGRARITLDAGGSASGGHLRAYGNLGASGFDNAIEGSPGGGRITNVPFYASVGSEGARYEETYGPRVANATIGTGGITEGIDSLGRVTVLGWPGPGLYDQVDFVTLTRGYPNGGAPQNADRSPASAPSGSCRASAGARCRRPTTPTKRRRSSPCS